MILNVLEYLEKAAEKYPDKIAFADQKDQITFKEVLQQAKAIGSYLSSLIGRTKLPVVVFIDRNISSVSAFLGVVYSGNFYVPVDHQLPRHRINLILDTIKPAAIILPKNLSDLVSQLDFQGQVVFFEDAIQQEIAADRLATLRRNAINTDPLYAMFTSGSTGVPKGTLICHRSVINLIENFREIYNFSEESIFGNQAPFDFDVSVKDIYSTLRNGATMHVIPKVMFSFPGQLIDFLNERRINTVIWGHLRVAHHCQPEGAGKGCARVLGKNHVLRGSHA